MGFTPTPNYFEAGDITHNQATKLTMPLQALVLPPRHEAGGRKIEEKQGQILQLISSAFLTARLTIE